MFAFITKNLNRNVEVFELLMIKLNFRKYRKYGARYSTYKL
jgi:hypothetical protein